VHELFGGQRRAARTLPFLHRAVGRFELGPRHHVQLRHLCRDALLQRAIEGESRIRDLVDLDLESPLTLRQYRTRHVANWLHDRRVTDPTSLSGGLSSRIFASRLFHISVYFFSR